MRRSSNTRKPAAIGRAGSSASPVTTIRCSSRMWRLENSEVGRVTLNEPQNRSHFPIDGGLRITRPTPNQIMNRRTFLQTSAAAAALAPLGLLAAEAEKKKRPANRPEAASGPAPV